MIDLRLDGGVGQDLCGLLEGGCAHPAFGCKGRLGDTHEKLGVGRLGESLLTCRYALVDAAVCRLQLADVNGCAGEQLGAAGILDLHLAHHLTHDDLNVLVVDVNALLTVDLLDLLDDVVANAEAAELVIVNASDAQHVVRAESAGGERLTLIDMLAVLDEDACRMGYGVNSRICLRLVYDADGKQSIFLGLFDGNGAGYFGKHRHFLGLACLEKLLDTGKTLSDVVARNAAGVEGTHRKLSTGFADGLCGNDADGLARIDGLADRKVYAVAPCADAGACLTGKDAADKHLLDAVRLKNRCIVGHEHMVGIEQHLSGFGIADGYRRESAVDAGAEGLHELTLVVYCGCPNAVRSAAVRLTDDNVLADIDHTAGKAGVCGTQSGIGKSLTGASGGDEVFQNGKSFTEVCLDGDLDGLTGGVRHKSAHTGKLTDLVHGAAGAGVCHHVDGVVGVETVLKSVGYVLRGMLPL